MNIASIAIAMAIMAFIGMWLFVVFWIIAESADTTPEEMKAQNKERRLP